MKLPIVIRWRKNVEAEAEVYVQRNAAQNQSNTIRNKMVAKLLHQNSQLKAVLHRWGLDYGTYSQGAPQKSKPPKGAGVRL